MTTIHSDKFPYAWGIALLLATTGCMKTVEEDYTAFHSKRFSPREQLAQVYTGDTVQLLQSDYLLIGYIDFTHNAQSCYSDYTCSNDSNSHLTMEFLRDRSAFRGADRIQIIESELILKPAEKSVCTSSSVQASFVNGVVVTTTVCTQYTNYSGFTESWQKRALLWRYEPELATAELNYEAAQKALPRLAADEAAESAPQDAVLPFAQLLEDRFDATTEADIYGAQLVIAIEADNTDFLQKELNSEALRNFEQQNQTSLLLMAYQLGRPRVYRWLIEQELNWASTPTNYSMLDYAIVFSRPDDVSLLLERHPYLESHWSKRDNIYIALAFAQFDDMLDFVLARGFSIDGIIEEKYSLLQLAIDAGNTVMVQALLEKGASLKPPTKDSLAPLLVAIQQNDTGMIGLLLDKGASLNDSDGKGNSAIHFAAAFAKPEVLQLLLDHGADIDRRNSNDLSPVYLSILDRNWETAETIMQLEVSYKPPEPETLFDTVRLLLYAAPSTSLAIFLDKTRLLQVSFLQDLVKEMAIGCARFCSEDSMAVLLDKGINANFTVGDTSLFSYAYAEGNEAAMIALIKHGYREYDQSLPLNSLQYALIDGDELKVRAYRLAEDNSDSAGDSGSY